MDTTRVSQEVRGRVLDRIRTALADGDEAKALRVARELQARWKEAEDRAEVLASLYGQDGERIIPSLEAPAQGLGLLRRASA